MQIEEVQYEPVVYAERTDRVTAEIVEKGIALQDVCGTRAAAEFLRLKMVDIRVTSRVLTQPSARRRCEF